MAQNRKKRTIWMLFAAAAAMVPVLLVVLMSCGASEELPPVSVATEETIPPNSWETDGYYMQDGFLRHAETQHRIGIDVSTHQGVIDWTAVAEAGVEFAIVRAGYRGSTEGRLYEDEQFRDNLEQARAAGIQVGVYFFSQALNVEEAEEEAKYVCDLLEGESLDLPVFFDWEETGSDSRTASLWEIPMTDCARVFCEAVTARGFEAGVYFNQYFAYNYLDLRELKDYTLWLAEYNVPPTFEYDFDCLQYSDSGTVAGIEVPVDLDLWLLTEE